MGGLGGDEAEAEDEEEEEEMDWESSSSSLAGVLLAGWSMMLAVVDEAAVVDIAGVDDVILDVRRCGTA